jgi:hypothetical protein
VLPTFSTESPQSSLLQMGDIAADAAENNDTVNATTDELNIPIGPANEDEEPKERITPENETRHDDDNVIPYCDDIGNPGNGDDDDFCIDEDHEHHYGDVGVDTWMNWVRTPGGTDVPNGGSTTSTKVIVDFQGTVSGRGSHIDLKIDSGSYVPVASPHTITRLSEGAHTIYLRAVDQAGNVHPTPAKWRFTVINDNNDD